MSKEKKTTGNLIEAIIYEETKNCEELINNPKTNLNEQDEDGNTALHYLAKGGDLKLAKLLINNKANLNLQNNDGDTPLHMAYSAQSNDKLMRLLITSKANVQIANEDKDMIFFECLEDNELLNHIIVIDNSDIDFNLKGPDGTATTKLVDNYCKYPAVEYLETIELLLDKGASLDQLDILQLLYTAKKNNNFESVSQLLTKNGYDLSPLNHDIAFNYLKEMNKIGLVDKLIKTKVMNPIENHSFLELLDEACKEQKLDVVKYLGDKDSSLFSSNVFLSDPPVHLVCDRQNTSDVTLEILKYLVQNKANLNQKNSFEKTIIEVACAQKNISFDIVRYLYTNNNEISDKLDASESSNLLGKISTSLVSMISNKNEKIFSFLSCCKDLSKKITKIIPKPVLKIVIKELALQMSKEFFSGIFKINNAQDEEKVKTSFETQVKGSFEKAPIFNYLNFTDEDFHEIVGSIKVAGE